MRTQNDREALLQGIKNGTIDLVCSNHTPHEDDCKNLEFQYADYGIIALTTTFAMLCTYTDLSVTDIVAQLSDNPRRIFGLPQPVFAPAEAADYTVFDTDTTWEVNDSTLFSKSKNTPLYGKTVQGKVWL